MADPDGAADGLWADLARWLEATLGLHFPQRLWPELRRGMEAAARRLHLPDAEACARRVLARPLGDAERNAIAECLAVGETYFFRDPPLFRQIAEHVLRPLIAARRDGSCHLRLWSAGCSSGEEAYSLAMLAASLLPDWRAWSLSILGTDINSAALRKARAGAYGPWSLRGPLPHGCARFLHQDAGGRHHVDAELRRRVHFGELNLAGDAYPSLATLTTGMDLVLCRNVLIYFEPERASSVLARLGASLAEGGWLVPGPVDIPAGRLEALRVVQVDGVFALRHAEAPAP